MSHANNAAYVYESANAIPSMPISSCDKDEVVPLTKISTSIVKFTSGAAHSRASTWPYSDGADDGISEGTAVSRSVAAPLVGCDVGGIGSPGMTIDLAAGEPSRPMRFVATKTTITMSDRNTKQIARPVRLLLLLRCCM